MEQERARPFLGYSSGAERSLWLNRAALKFCQINFLPVVKMTTSGDGIGSKGNKQGNCIFYCQRINFIVWNMNSFSAVALGGVSVSVCAGTWCWGRSIPQRPQAYCSRFPCRGGKTTGWTAPWRFGWRRSSAPRQPGRHAAPCTRVPRRRRQEAAVRLLLLII